MKLPTEPPSADALYEAAVRALARRARSAAEIRLLLEKKNATQTQIEAALKRLRENGYLDDARFARYVASARLEGELQGKARVSRELKARKVKEAVAEEAIQSAYQDIDEGALLRRYIQRKVNLKRAFAKPSSLVSLHQRLLRAGFRSDTIVQELKKILPRMAVGVRAAASSATEPMTLETTWDELLDSLSEISATEDEGDQ